MLRAPIAMLMTLLAVSAPGAQAPSRPADDQAVREVIHKYVQARELRDPRAIEALFTADADQHTTSGEWRRGRPQLVSGTLESSTRSPGTRSIRVESVRFITLDVAIADGPYEITDGADVRRMWTTLLLEREGGTWRIAAIRNMVPAATGGSPGAR